MNLEGVMLEVKEITQRKTDAMGYYLSVGSNKLQADYECDRKRSRLTDRVGKLTATVGRGRRGGAV